MCQGRSGWVLVPVSVLMLSLLAGCLGSGSSSNRSAQPAREHDDRIASGYYQLDVDSLQFAALDGFDDADRWWGELDGAGYRIEVPDTWNGTLVMYAHGYRGDEPDLTVDIPELRPHLLDRGYAWAASSYRANHYDVRSGVEDTNRLARYFSDEFGSPGTTYIIGQSMGGHVAAAAIEEETMEQANNGYSYDGVLALCGVMGDVELLSYFAAYNLAAMELAGVGADSFPIDDAASRADAVRENLFLNYGEQGEELLLTPEGEKLRAILRNLSGGPRPMFDEAFVDAATARSQLDEIHAFANDDGTARGILARNIVDTREDSVTDLGRDRGIVYRFESQPGESLTGDERAFNNAVFRVTPDSDPNPEQEDGLRWVPRLEGKLTAPIISLHTLGDLWVPFSMQQEYARRVEERNREDLLVQRAIRAIQHCDITMEEQAEAFDDLVAWVNNPGQKPDGDDVLDPDVVSQEDYGSQFTRD